MRIIAIKVWCFLTQVRCLEEGEEGAAERFLALEVWLLLLLFAALLPAPPPPTLLLVSLSFFCRALFFGEASLAFATSFSDGSEVGIASACAEAAAGFAAGGEPPAGDTAGGGGLAARTTVKQQSKNGASGICVLCAGFVCCVRADVWKFCHFFFSAVQEFYKETPSHKKADSAVLPSLPWVVRFLSFSSY